MDLRDQNLLAEHFAHMQRITCDLSFANLHIWRDCEAPFLTFVHQNPCILIAPHGGSPYFLEPLGNNDLVETVKVCLNHAGRISRARESFVDLLPQDLFHVVPERDHFDYLYKVNTLSELKGKSFDGKRNHIKRFLKNHPQSEFRPLEAQHLDQAIALFERWSQERGSNGEEKSGSPPLASLECQRRALKTAFGDYQRLGLVGGAIFVAGEIEGFIVGSQSNPETITFHFQYANHRMPGIYQVLLWEACRSVFSSYAYVNLEEDLGLPGLRKTKLSYHPLQLEKKFQVTYR